MLDPVDLDDHSPLLPHHVEDVAPERRAADDLAGGLRNATSPALARELELADGANASQQVEQHGVQEQPALVATDAQHLLGDLRSAGQALLHGLVITSAACLLLRAQNAARTAATAGRLRGTPSSTTSSGAHRRVCRMSRPRARRIARTSRHGHADAGLVEALQPRRFERGSTV